MRPKCFNCWRPSASCWSSRIMCSGPGVLKISSDRARRDWAARWRFWAGRFRSMTLRWSSSARWCWVCCGCCSTGNDGGLGGALQIPREPAQLFLDMGVIADAFVVVVVGGMGSIPGAALAAFIIGEIKAYCVGIGQVGFLGYSVSLSKLTLVAEFIVMAIVLVVRPWGLLGRHQGMQRSAGGRQEPPLRPAVRSRQI